MHRTYFSDSESNEAVVDVDLPSLLNDFGKAGIVHPDNLSICFVFVTLGRHHTNSAALSQLHLLLHFLFKYTHTHTEQTIRERQTLE